VYCEKELWDKLDYWDRVRCVAEEVMTLSIERDLLPRIIHNPTRPIDNVQVKQSVRDRLMRVCNQTCSGWFADFAILNYYKILSIVPKDFHVEPLKVLYSEWSEAKL
jgi:hypothetical protein